MDREELKRYDWAKYGMETNRLGRYVSYPALLAQLEAKEAEIARLKAAQGHTAMQASVQHMEANTQASIVKSVLTALGLPLHDWEAESLIVGKFNELRASRDADIERAVRLAVEECEKRCPMIDIAFRYSAIAESVLSQMKEPT